MIEIDLFHRLVEKYKLIEIIPEDIQRYVVRSRKRVLKSSLKAVNDLGFFYSFVISLYFRARRMGFRPSVFASKIIVMILSMIITAFIVSGLLIASINIIPLISPDNAASTWIIQDYKKKPELEKVIVTDKQDQTYDEMIIEEESEIVDKGIHEQELKKDLKDEKGEISKKITRTREQKTAPDIKARLGIIDLVPRGVENKEAVEISNKLYRSLRKLRGSEGVIYLAENRGQKNVNRQLMGRLSKLGSSYVLAVRVVDSSTGDVLYDKTITYKKDVSIDDKIADVAREINNVPWIWE